MNKSIAIWLLFGLIGLSACTNTSSRILFDGTDVDNWYTSGNVSVEDSILVISGLDSYAVLKNSKYKDFDLNLKMRTVQGGKGFIGIHTDDTGKGYRIAVNNDIKDPVWWKMTGSLLSVRNLTKSLVKDGQWFDLNIRVEGQAVSVKVNGTVVVEYIEPARPWRISPNENAALSEGTLSLVSESKGNIEFKEISIKTLNRKDINIPAQIAVAKNEQDDDILRLHQEDFPVLDYHVHLKGGFTKEAAARQSRRTGINYAIAPNCGIGFTVTDDKGIYAFLDSMRTQPFILAMQGEGREWVTTFSEKARNEFDFIFTDALTFTDMKGRRVRLWINDEVIIDDEQKYMDMIVDKTCQVMKEPANIFVNPFFLPEQMSDRYDMFWTDERVEKVIDAIIENGKVLEINELYHIPSKAIIAKAKKAGVKFSFGSNNVSPEVGRLEYSIQMKKECGLTSQDMYKPPVKL